MVNPPKPTQAVAPLPALTARNTKGSAISAQLSPISGTISSFQLLMWRTASAHTTMATSPAPQLNACVSPREGV